MDDDLGVPPFLRRAPHGLEQHQVAEELDVATTAPGEDHRDFLATEGAPAVKPADRRSGTRVSMRIAMTMKIGALLELILVGGLEHQFYFPIYWE